MKFVRFLTILLTTLCLYTVQTIHPAQAQSMQGFLSGGANGQGQLLTVDNEANGDAKAGLNMNMIILLALVLVIPKAIKMCKRKMDVKIFAGAGILYGVNEMLNWSKYKKESKREMSAYQSNDVEANQAQIASLREAAGQTEAAAAAAERRAKSGMIAAAGFGAASAMALVGAFRNAPFKRVNGVCTGPNDCLFNQCKAAVAYNSTHDYYLNYGKDQKVIATTDYGYLDEYSKNARDDFDFLVRQTEVDRYINGATQSLPQSEVSFLEDIFSDSKAQHKITKAFKEIGLNLAELLIPKVHAAAAAAPATGALGLSPVGTTAVAAKSGFVKRMVKKGLKNGLTRAAMYGAFAGIALAVAAKAKSAADALRDRSNQYNELADRLNTQTISAPNHNSVADATIPIGAIPVTNVGTMPNGAKDSCVTGSGASFTIDSDCQCRSKNKCKKSEIPKIKMAKVELPNAITSSVSSLAGSAEGIYNGDFEKGLANAASAGKNAARLDKISIGLRKKINEGLVGSGNKALDLDKFNESFKAKLIKAARDDIKNLNDNARNALASSYPGVFNEDADVDKDPNADLKVGDTKAITGSPVKIAAKSNSGSKRNNFSLFDLDDDHSDQQGAGDQEQALGLTDDTAQIALNEDDIDGNRNKNIFKLITKRYFKTAYPLFFEAE